jgi:cell division protein FtsL
MAINLKLPDLKNRKKKIKIPTKNHINILAKRKKETSPRKRLLTIAIAAVVLLVAGKFLVYDRVAAVTTETAKLASIQEEIASTEQQIGDLQEYEDLYAHYTFSGMTEEELSRVSRVKAMRMVENAFTRGNVSRNWDLTGNVMTLQVSGSSLRGLNQLASELESNPIVERCVISSADKRTDANGNVVVTFTVYLQKPNEGGN